MSKEHREKIRLAAIERHAARRAAAEGASPPPVSKVEPPVVILAKPVEAPAVTPTAVSFAEDLRSAVKDAVTEVAAAPPSGKPYDLAVVDPDALFKLWLGSPTGRNASDTRMPTDTVRLGIDLDDRLRKAFLAGFNAGRGLA